MEVLSYQQKIKTSLIYFNIILMNEGLNMKYYKNKKNRILLGNIFSLASLQALNYLLPILILPFLVRSIGIGNIGVISTAFAISIYFQMFGEYGFNLTATKEVARQRDDITYINKLFSAVLYIKIIFLLIGFLIYICIVELIPEYSHSFLIFLFTYLITIGQTLFPTWLFQGFEQMKFITIINGLTKISGAIITIFIVRTPSDSYLVPLINGIFAIIGTSLAFIVAYQRLNVRVNSFDAKVISILLKDGWYIFQSKIFSTLYKNSNIIILGFFANPTTVGLYSLLERVIRSVQMIQNVLGDALFPYVNRNVKRDEILPLLKKYNTKAILFYISLTFCLIVFSPLISYFLLNAFNSSFILMLCIFSLVLFFGGLSYYYGVLGLISIGKTKSFSSAVFATGVVNIFLCIVMSKYFDGMGAVITSVISELILFCIMVFIIGEIELKKRNEKENY